VQESEAAMRRFIIRGRFLAALALCVLGGGGGSAQDVLPDILKAQLGEWLVVPDDGAPGCRVVLESAKAKGGRVARPASDCGSKLPALAKATTWSMNGGVTLKDAAGVTILAFGEDETTLLKTAADRSPQYFMVQARPGVERAPSRAAMPGRWELRRPGGPTLCRLTLKIKPAESENDDPLAVEPGCDPAVARLKLATWRVEDFTLMLYGANDASLAFEPSRDGFDKAARERGKPLSLVKSP
jgi:hypothetical protein